MTAQLAMRRSDGRLTRATDTTAHHASCVKTVKRIVDKLLSPNSVVILVFSELIAVYKFKTLTEALNTGGYKNIVPFGQQFAVSRKRCETKVWLLLSMDDYWKIVCFLSNHVASDDLD